MRVPLNAFFYWAGGPLPWLRARGIASFQKHHPGWSVFLGSPDLREAPPGVVLLRDGATDPALPPAARSDHWRYLALHEHGGLYADTDVVFVKSVEPLLEGDHDAWVTTDLGTPAGPLRISIGVLAARHGSAFFGRAAALAARAPASPDYQSHGTKLLAPRWSALASGLSLGALPARSFYRGWRDEQVARLWVPSSEAPAEHEFALHWYGGSPASALGAAARSIEELPRCLVRRALET